MGIDLKHSNYLAIELRYFYDARTTFASSRRLFVTNNPLFGTEKVYIHRDLCAISTC